VGDNVLVPRKVVTLTVVLALVCVGLLGLRVVQVRSESGEWRLSPSAAPPTVHVLGRDYSRSGEAPEPPEGTLDLDTLGRTDGGGVIFLPPMATDIRPVPTVIHVFDGETTWSYELVGGP